MTMWRMQAFPCPLMLLIGYQELFCAALVHTNCTSYLLKSWIYPSTPRSSIAPLTGKTNSHVQPLYVSQTAVHSNWALCVYTGQRVDQHCAWDNTTIPTPLLIPTHACVKVWFRQTPPTFHSILHPTHNYIHYSCCLSF